MKPIVEYINLETIYEDEEFSRYLPKIVSFEETTSREFAKEFEMRFLRRFSSSFRENIVKKVVEKHINVAKIDDLIKQISNKLEE